VFSLYTESRGMPLHFKGRGKKAARKKREIRRRYKPLVPSIIQKKGVDALRGYPTARKKKSNLGVKER